MRIDWKRAHEHAAHVRHGHGTAYIASWLDLGQQTVTHDQNLNLSPFKEFLRDLCLVEDSVQHFS